MTMIQVQVIPILEDGRRKFNLKHKLSLSEETKKNAIIFFFSSSLRPWRLPALKPMMIFAAMRRLTVLLILTVAVLVLPLLVGIASLQEYSVLSNTPPLTGLGLWRSLRNVAA